jgi:hypothetical protein
MKTLFNNDYCKIIEDAKGNWFRLDKVTGDKMKVLSYFNHDGVFTPHPSRPTC